MRIIRSLMLALSMTTGGALVTTSSVARELPLDVALTPRTVDGSTVRDLQVSPGGQFVSYTESAEEDPDATLLWETRSSGGKSRLLLDTRKLDASSDALSEERMKRLERRHAFGGYTIDYRWSADGRDVLVNVDGRLLMIDALSGHTRPLYDAGDRVADAHLAAGARWISFVRDHNLYLLDLRTGRSHTVAADASETVLYGVPDFVTQEEIQRFTGAWWSPDGHHIAYTRTDQSKVREVQRVKIDSDAISVVKERYAVTGTDNSEVRVLIADANGGVTVEVDLGTDTDIYVFQVMWSPDGQTLYVERQSRDQKRLDLLAVDPLTGRSRVLVSELSDTWVELERTFRPLANGNFLWGSSRTGWQHLYLYTREGVLIRPVTSGAWRVANLGATGAPDESPIVSVDEKAGNVFFIASIDTPLERQLYRVSYRHSDTPHPLTRGHGWWEPVMATSSPRVFLANYSDPETPPQCGLYDLTGRRIAWIKENRLDETHPFFPYLDHVPSREFATINAADGELLYYVLAKPANFDPSRRYPAIVSVYGGPNVQAVTRSWYPIEHVPLQQIFTQQGYVVFQLDNRGSANRSQKFEHAIYGALGKLSTVDQRAGINFLRSLAFVDRDHIGMVGWSFGAYETFRTMSWPSGDSGILAGVAGGTPSDFHLYDTHYTERYLGKPRDHEAAYADADLLTHAKDLRGHLLLLHGLSDDNVVLTNFTALVSELQDRHQVFDTDVFPGQSHMFRGLAAQWRQYNDYLRFFNRWLQPSLNDASGR